MKVFKSRTKNIARGFTFGFVIILFLLLAGKTEKRSIAQSRELVVCPSGCSYTSIQKAINDAVAGDKIIAQSGTYRW